MKEIKSFYDLNDIKNNTPYIIFYGNDKLYNSKLLERDLINIEEQYSEKYNFFFIKSIDIITNLGYNSLPLIELVTKTKKLIINNIDELKEKL